MKTRVSSRSHGVARPTVAPRRAPPATSLHQMSLNQISLKPASLNPVSLAQGNPLIQRALATPSQLAPPEVMALQRSVGNRAVQRLLQGDPTGMAAERAAENVAGQVTGGGTVQRAVVPRGTGQSDDGGLMTPDLERKIEGARGQGNALPLRVQRRMEGALGADLGGVRVHTDKQANTLSRSLEARAFTTGRDIFFKEGEYDPAGSSGQRLLAHELTHVVQQGGAQQVGGGQQGIQRAPVMPRTPLVQRVSDEELQTGLGKYKYGKVKELGKLPFFLALSKKSVDKYRTMENTLFVEEVKKVSNPGMGKKKRKGGVTPSTPELQTDAPSTESSVVESPMPETEPEVPKVDPEVEKQLVRESIAKEFELTLTSLLERFGKVKIDDEKDVMGLLDDVIVRALLPLFNEGMLRRSDNLMKVVDKLHALHVTAWTFNKTKICTRLVTIFTDMERFVPNIKDFAEHEGLGKKVTAGKDLDTTRKNFIRDQRAAVKDVANPSLKVTSTLTIEGYKVLQWYEEATRNKLSQFYDSSSKPAQITHGNMEHESIGKGNWLDVWAKMRWKDKYIKDRYRNYGQKNDKGQFSLLGDIDTGGTKFNVEDKLWVKEGMGTATRYNVLGENLDKRLTSKERAQHLREVVGGDFSNATELEKEAALAMFGAETARNPRSYGIGLMLLDMIEEDGTYGSTNKKYNFGKLLGSSPHHGEKESDWERRKTQTSLPKQNRWRNMKGSIDREAPKFSTSPFKALWAGKWSMSPSGSMSLGTSVIPSDSTKLNTVQYKELKTILNWYINFMKGAELSVKDESEAKTALVKLFKERLGKTAKMGVGSFKQHFDVTA